MLRFFASAGLLLSLAGCAAAVVRPAAVPASAALRPGPDADQGTIIALRPVPTGDSQPVAGLLRQLGPTAPAAGAMEFIVQADDGTTLSVVQPAEPALRRGSRVGIERGAQTRIDARSDVAAAR